MSQHWMRFICIIPKQPCHSNLTEGNMKKRFSFILILLLIMTVLAGCSSFKQRLDHGKKTEKTRIWQTKKIQWSGQSDLFRIMQKVRLGKNDIMVAGFSMIDFFEGGVKKRKYMIDDDIVYNIQDQTVHQPFELKEFYEYMSFLHKCYQKGYVTHRMDDCLTSEDEITTVKNMRKYRNKRINYSPGTTSHMLGFWPDYSSFYGELTEYQEVLKESVDCFQEKDLKKHIK